MPSHVNGMACPLPRRTANSLAVTPVPVSAPGQTARGFSTKLGCQSSPGLGPMSVLLFICSQTHALINTGIEIVDPQTFAQANHHLITISCRYCGEVHDFRAADAIVA